MIAPFGYCHAWAVSNKPNSESFHFLSFPPLSPGSVVLTHDSLNAFDRDDVEGNTEFEFGSNSFFVFRNDDEDDE